MKRKEHSDYILHLLYANPISRGSVKVIEDIVTLNNITVKINLGKEVKKVALVPEKKDLEFSFNEGAIQFTVPELKGHQMIQIK